MISNKLDPVARVCITTIQRLYSMLKGEEDLDPVLEEGSQFDTAADLIREPMPVVYNSKIPIETFDVIFTDECHRSIYNLWRQVLEYFDAYLIGLTATPSNQTIGFFNQNLVMEYNHEQAVADGVNVDFDVYRIRTQITERVNLQFRAEFFNTFNHPNFALPNGSITPGVNADGSLNIDPNTGRPAPIGLITQTPDVAQGNPGLGGGGPRVIQFALRFGF